jgi:dUTP pyrophosphatase
MRIRYKKIHEQVITPYRANPSDAGLDVFYFGYKPIYIESLQNVLIPTGLVFEIPHGYYLNVCNRGSMGAKKCLVRGAHVIDSGYSGEIFIDLHNIGTHTQSIVPGDKIAQLLMLPVVPFIAEEVDSSVNLYDTEITISNRGEGALGSTDG